MTQQQGIKKIVIIQGHPDDHDHHYGHALAESYIRGAQEAGHELKNIEVSKLQFAVLRTRKDWEKGSPDNDIEQALQRAVKPGKRTSPEEVHVSSSPWVCRRLFIAGIFALIASKASNETFLVYAVLHR